MNRLTNLIIYILNFIDLIIKSLFNKDLRGLIFDRLQLKFEDIKINNTVLKIYCPSSISRWRAKTYLSKEPDTLKWIDDFKKYKSSDIIFWDIGANIGLYTMYSCSIHTNNIEVISFEPSINNLKSLATNISTNNFQNKVKILPNPLNNMSKFSTFYESSTIEGSALNSFSNNLDFEGKEFNPTLSYQTLGFTLDNLVENSFLKIPNFIKIDVDGNEHLLLEGFKNNLANNQILQILIEINENYQEQFENIQKLMTSNNFNLTDKFKASILSDNQDNFSKTYNYIFKR